MQGDILYNTALWFKKAIPNPTTKNFHTQLGVHFEEVSEMLAEVTGVDGETRLLIEKAKQANHELAEHLKKNNNVVYVKHEDRTNFLDACCDQIVTATGSALLLDMNIVDAMNEVNESNFSKFDENGNPIFDENLKVQKGPNYFKANLAQFAY